MKRYLLTATLLVLLAGASMALPEPVGRNKTHVVQDKETIYTIARQYGLAADHVLWANGLTMNRLPKVGDELLIPLRRIPPFTPAESTAIVLNLPERMLYLFRGHRVAKFWGVAIGGPQYPTPDGDFHVLAKEKNPTWEPPKWLERKPMGPGPDNPLGDRWLQITPDMVGIHGTNNPDSIGVTASLGCVRLYPEAIHELYDQVSVGTPVYVTYEQARVGREPDGTLVWSFFPDPYTRYLAKGQARAWLNEARAEGSGVDISDFEIKERAEETDGLISPVYGFPIQVESDLELSGISALRKPTGEWIRASVLEKEGLKVQRQGKVTVVSSKDGKKVARLTASDLPLNPHRLPRLEEGEELKLEGHSWRGDTWLPLPLVLDYFEIPYKWDKKESTLTLL